MVHPDVYLSDIVYQCNVGIVHHPSLWSVSFVSHRTLDIDFVNHSGRHGKWFVVVPPSVAWKWPKFVSPAIAISHQSVDYHWVVTIDTWATSGWYDLPSSHGQIIDGLFVVHSYIVVISTHIPTVLPTTHHDRPQYVRNWINVPMQRYNCWVFLQWYCSCTWPIHWIHRIVLDRKIFPSVYPNRYQSRWWHRLNPPTCVVPTQRPSNWFWHSVWWSVRCSVSRQNRPYHVTVSATYSNHVIFVNFVVPPSVLVCTPWWLHCNHDQIGAIVHRHANKRGI